MPRDVSTRWNSTHDMLTFAVEHKIQLTQLTSALTNNLRAYKLSQDEWRLAEELRDVLKVNKHLILTHAPSSYRPSICTDLERCY